MSSVTLRIDLADSRPPVWREIRVPRAIPLPTLHHVIQLAMGWENSHLHGFARGKRYWPADERWVQMPEGPGEHTEVSATLDDLLGSRRRRLTYMYDFGDDWEHSLTVTDSDARNMTHVELIGGQGACPPEDCGGVPGFAQLVETMRRLRHGTRVDEDEQEWFENMVGSGDLDDLAAELLEFDEDQVRELFETVDLGQLEQEATAENEMFAAGLSGDLASALSGYLTSLSEGSFPSLPDAAPSLPPLREELQEKLRYSLLLNSTAILDLVEGARLDQVEELSANECEKLTANIRWYLDFVGDGRRLTAAGYLPPADVETIADQLLTDRTWIGAGNREAQTLPVLAFRAALRSLGLLRVEKGRLLPVKAARRAMADPVRLVEHCARRMPVEKAEFDRTAAYLVLLQALGPDDDTPASTPAGTAADVLSRTGPVSAGLTALGWRTQGGGPVPEVYARGSASDSRNFLMTVGAAEDRRLGPEALTDIGRKFIAQILRG